MSRRRRRLVWLFVALGILAVLVVASDRILRGAASWLDVGEPPRRSDYVVVLGGGLETRPFVAAALVRRGLAKKVLVSHSISSVEVQDGILPPDHELTVRVLVNRGVPREDAILLGYENATTYDEARALADFLQASPQSRVIIPTNEWHTRRARWIFAQVMGEQISQVSFSSIPTEEFHIETWWRSEEGFRVIVGENLKFAFYVLRYGRLRYAAGILLALFGFAIICRRWRARRRSTRPPLEPLDGEHCEKASAEGAIEEKVVDAIVPGITIEDVESSIPPEVCGPLHVATPSRYWCPYHLIVTVEGPEGARSVTTAKPYARVGADESADVVLPRSRLPRRALYLHGTEEGVFWVNLAELTDTEGPLRGWLRADEGIPFGPYRISARLDDNGHAPALPPPDLCAKGTLPEPQPSVLIAFDDQPVARRRLSRRLTLVGRRRPSDLRISSHDLSASHLVLYWEAGTIWAVDLLSRTGTKLNGESIEAGPFPVGSWLTAGEVKLKYGQQFSGSASPSDSTIPLGRPLALLEAEAEVALPADTACHAEETPEHQSAAVLLADSVRQRLETDRLEWERRQAAIAEELRQAISRLTAELAALKQRDAESDKRRREFEARCREAEEGLVRRQAALAAEQSYLERRRMEFDQRQAEVESVRGQLDAERREMEQERTAFAAERDAVETRLGEESLPLQRLSDTSSGAPAPARQDASPLTPASKPPAEPSMPGMRLKTAGMPLMPTPKPSADASVAPLGNGRSNRDSSGDDPDARYDAVMDRLFRVSRARRGWWSRVRSAFSRRSSNDLLSETTDTPESDERSGEPQ